MSWLQKLLPPKIKRDAGPGRKVVPEGLWVKCDGCEAVLYRSDLEKNLGVCPKCSRHSRIDARQRIEMLLDPEGRYEIGAEISPVDTLKFRDSRRYVERLEEARKDTDEADALVVMQGSVKSVSLVAAAFEFRFLGGSMGSVVGERFVRGLQVCVEQKLPFVCITASGGARMQANRGATFVLRNTAGRATCGVLVVDSDPELDGDGNHASIRHRRPHDVALDHDVVRSADEQQVLDVVAPQQDQLALPVQLVDVDDAEARLPAAAAAAVPAASSTNAAPAANAASATERTSPAWQTKISLCRARVQATYRSVGVKSGPKPLSPYATTMSASRPLNARAVVTSTPAPRRQSAASSSSYPVRSTGSSSKAARWSRRISPIARTGISSGCWSATGSGWSCRPSIAGGGG